LPSPSPDLTARQPHAHWVARMTKRSASTGAWQERLPCGGSPFRSTANVPLRDSPHRSVLRVVRSRPPHALDPGEEIARAGQPIIKVKVVAVHDDGRVDIAADDLKLMLWYHDPDCLRSALRFGGRAEWKPKYHVLYVISSGSFNLAALARVTPRVPPIRRRPTETTRQFIERAMRENHGYTVPEHWLADLDAVPDGDTGEAKSGYLGGIETPTDPTLLESLPPTHGRQDTPTAARDPGEGQP
jgi:hypothetical protein